MNLKSAESAINGAWLAGLVVGALTLIWTIAALLLSSGQSRGAAMALFANVVILFALAYGVWRKNKICAVLLAVYFASLVTWKAASWVQNKAMPLGILSDFVALLLCANGVRGVLAYHRIKHTEAQTEFKL
jgi:uncharacterized membrane protein (UPF0136 family)